MPTDTITAKREMSRLVPPALAAWPETVVQYDGIDTNEPVGSDKDWVRVTIRHDPEGHGQGSLSGPAAGVVRWRRAGTVTVQCFARMDTGGRDQADQMACAVRDAFQGRATAGGVWFRKCGTREVGRDKHWYQVNATISFEYDEVK